MSYPKVVVQILLYATSPEEIDKLFSSLEKVDYPKSDWQLVVWKSFLADSVNGDYFCKTWLPKSGLTLPEIIFFNSPTNPGFAGGHVEASNLTKDWSPDYLYLLNDDAWVAPDFLSKAVAVAEENPRAALVQSLVMMDNGEQINSIGNAMHFLGFGFSLGHRQRLEELKNDLPMFYPSGAGLLVRTKVLEKIGGLFDPDYFMYHEDLDLGWRARLAGFDILLDPESKIFHHYEFSRSIKKFYLMERNRHLTNLANYKWPTLLLILPAALIMELGTLVFSFKSGWWKEKLRSGVYFFRPATWQRIFKRRALIKNLRAKTDREMLKFIAGVIVNQEVDNSLMNNLVNPVLNFYFKILKRLVSW
ncbi:MAG: glycosyltransferase family 2 protein [Candidatus Uhrbacteria bacterium]